jgi:hypothetical protein
MLQSFLRHNNYEINVFGTTDDLMKIEFTSEKIKFGEFRDSKFIKTNLERSILKGYKRGHVGTSILWANLIKTRPEQYLIHLDADTIFLGNVIDELIFQLKHNNVAIVGSRRPYRNRNFRLSDKDSKKLSELPDTVNTDCFGFNRSKIRGMPNFILKRKIEGKRTSFRPVIDFFDPITHDFVKQNYAIAYLDTPQEGFHSTPNLTSNFHSKRISFAAVGSGINFLKNPETKTSVGYKNFALSSYSLYAKYILDRQVDFPPLVDPILEDKLKRLDKTNWTLT